MRSYTRRCVGIGLAFAFGVSPLKAQATRPVTVADTIAMTEVVSQGPGLHDFMLLSPNRDHFAVIVERGDVSTDQRVFSLLIFRTQAVFERSADTVAVLRTSSNEDAIADVRWLDDNRLTFLGTGQNGSTQVYAADIRSKNLRQLTQHPTNINAYAVAPRLERVIYTADADLASENQRLRLHGLTVTDQSFADLVMGNLVSGRLRWRDIGYELPQETFIKQLSSGGTRRIAGNSEFVAVPNALFPYSRNPVSPDGRYAVLQGLVHSREKWRLFQSPFPSMVDGSRDLTTFVLVDLTSGVSSQLIDAPSSSYLTSVVWAPDSRSVVLVNTFLPAKGDDKPIGQTVVAEVDLASRRVTPIAGPTMEASVAHGVVCGQALDWKRRENSLVLGLSKSPDTSGGVCDMDEVATYQKAGLAWREISVADVDSALRSSSDGRITISLDQGLNMPPNLKAVDHRKGRTRIFTDFNPQLRNLQVGPVTLITWAASDGTVWSGDLYTPPEGTRGKPYPLVIQTHGCTTDKFDLTGFGPGGATGYAAQVLASNGIVVLQEGHCANEKGNPPPVSRPYYSSENAEHELLGYESAIDLLERRGLIDRNRVGLQGHSATSWTVVYAIAHPKPSYNYAAVLSTARGDMGYFAYLATAYGRLWNVQGNASVPVGVNFETFWRSALPFHLENVTTPIMSQEPDGLRYVPLMWEIHEVLRMLGKPEEFLIFPDGTHNLVKPWERLTSQQASVDWFCFWLKGEEDPDSAKTEQYARWRSMRRSASDTKQSSRQSFRDELVDNRAAGAKPKVDTH